MLSAARSWRLRLMFTVLLSSVLAVFAFAVADNSKIPEAFRWIFSPGYVASMHTPPVPTFSENLTRSVGVGLIVNFAYYFLISWGLLAVFRQPRRNHR